MNELNSDEEDVVKLRQRLPLHWEERTMDDPGRLDALMHDNEALLANQAWLEDYELGPHDELLSDEPKMRMEVRLNLLISVLGMWMRRQAAVPPTVPVVLGEHTLCWDTNEPPPANAHLMVDLYLNQRFPMPLIVPLVVWKVERSDGDLPWRVEGHLENLSAATKQGIASLAFRYHRKSLRERRDSSDVSRKL